MKALIELMFLVFILGVLSTIIFGLLNQNPKDKYYKENSSCRQSGDVAFVYTENGQQEAKSQLEADGVINNFKSYSFKEACNRK